ncbi:MAG: hypothetical protein ACW98Y_09215 [Candidatus Thorarchaeota archaeon]|jgi:hypothetical protein
MTIKDRQIARLGKQLEKAKVIFLAQAGRATNPDGSDEYWAAKKKFDAADRKIKKLEKELARLITGGEPLDAPSFDNKFPDLDDTDGLQSQPSQSKVKVSD